MFKVYYGHTYYPNTYHADLASCKAAIDQAAGPAGGAAPGFAGVIFYWYYAVWDAGTNGQADYAPAAKLIDALLTYANSKGVACWFSYCGCYYTGWKTGQPNPIPPADGGSCVPAYWVKNGWLKVSNAKDEYVTTFDAPAWVDQYIQMLQYFGKLFDGRPGLAGINLLNVETDFHPYPGYSTTAFLSAYKRIIAAARPAFPTTPLGLPCNYESASNPEAFFPALFAYAATFDAMYLVVPDPEVPPTSTYPTPIPAPNWRIESGPRIFCGYDAGGRNYGKFPDWRGKMMVQAAQQDIGLGQGGLYLPISIYTGNQAKYGPACNTQQWLQPSSKTLPADANWGGPFGIKATVPKMPPIQHAVPSLHPERYQLIGPGGVVSTPTPVPPPPPPVVTPPSVPPVPVTTQVTLTLQIEAPAGTTVTGVTATIAPTVTGA